MLYRSHFFQIQHILINVLKSLSSIICICNLLVIFLTKIARRIFCSTYRENVLSDPREMAFRRSVSTAEVPLRLLLIYFNASALTPRLHWAETAMEVSEDKRSWRSVAYRLRHRQTELMNTAFEGIAYVHHADCMGRETSRSYP
jgi:hypothetical protein